MKGIEEQELVIGQSTLVHLVKSITTIAKLKYHNGRSRANGLIGRGIDVELGIGIVNWIGTMVVPAAQDHVSDFIASHYCFILYLFFLQLAGHDKHSNSRSSNSSSSSKDVLRDGATGSQHWSSRDDGDHKEPRGSRKHPDENATQDMDISPGDSTPTSEVSYSTSAHVPLEQNSHGPVLLANALPRLISHPQHLPSTPTTIRSESSPLTNPASTPSMVPPPSNIITTCSAPGPPASHHANNSLNDGINSDGKSLSSRILSENLGQLSVDTNHTGASGEGPPTPTHSEAPECNKGTI